MNNKNNFEAKIRTFPPFIPVSKWGEIVGDRSTSSLRWDIFINKNDIRNRCIITRGSRLLVNVSEYFKWLVDHSNQDNRN